MSLLRLVERTLKTDFRKELSPQKLEFAWLSPNIAWAFCSDALCRRSDCQYLAFHEAHMELHGRAFQANIFIADMVFLADTRSAEELAVFTNMAPERLCLGCGLRVAEKFTSIFPGEREPLFAASVKLLQFALRVASASAFAKELRRRRCPAASHSAIGGESGLSLLGGAYCAGSVFLEGRTDCLISGVFGAGKTRAAAAHNCRLTVLVMDPTLKVMAVSNPHWKRNLVGWSVPLNWKKAQPAKQSLISRQATVTQSWTGRCCLYPFAVEWQSSCWLGTVSFYHQPNSPTTKQPTKV